MIGGEEDIFNYLNYFAEDACCCCNLGHMHEACRLVLLHPHASCCYFASHKKMIYNSFAQYVSVITGMAHGGGSIVTQAKILHIIFAQSALLMNIPKLSPFPCLRWYHHVLHSLDLNLHRELGDGRHGE